MARYPYGMALGTTILIGAGFALLALIILGYFVSIYNGLIRLKNNIEKAWSNIDVLLKQRHDELPKLIDTVKGYMKHEQETLQQLTEARTAFMDAESVKEKAAANNQVESALKSIFAVAEDYPDLKAQESFQQLQERISGLENEIADRREFYNDAVNQYNIRIHSIPDVIVASMLNYQDRELFEVSEADKEDVDIEF
jgi:LemA protein